MERLRETWRSQLTGFAFGLVVTVAAAVGLEVYAAVDAAPDAALVDVGFWKTVGVAAFVTAVRSSFTAIATLLGRSVPGVT